MKRWSQTRLRIDPAANRGARQARGPLGTLVLCAMALACGEAKGDAAKPAPSGAREAPKARATRVEIAEMITSSPTLTLRLPGEVEGAREAKLAAALGGLVEKVHVKVGDRVRAGASLAWVDRAMHDIAVKQATLQVEQAKTELDRVERAGKSLATSRRDAARFAFSNAEAALAMAELRARRANVRAPFSGVVADVDVEVGEVVPPAGEIARLVQVDPIHVSVTVSDKDIVSLEKGLDVEIDTSARAERFAGKISSVSPAADLRTRAFEALVEVPNKERLLLPGMIATVSVRKPLGDSVLAIPQHVLVTRREGNGVFIHDDGVARWRVLELGRVVQSQVIVTGGLAVGEEVVVVGHRELADGDPLIVSRRGKCCSEGVITFEGSE